jgi:hypothetical protein
MASPKTEADRAKRDALEKFKQTHPRMIKPMPPSTRNQRRTAHKQPKE